MKLVIFAHTPPPHHGQSYMVQLMLEGFGGDHQKRRQDPSSNTTEHKIDCYHINARVSDDLEDIGQFHLKKLILLLGHCLSAIWCRFRYRAKTLYYIPAPAKHSAVFRDWIVMLMCRPFFFRTVFHWHAAGLSEWLETSAPAWMRSLTIRLMKGADLSIVLSEYNRADAETLESKSIILVPNGIPDPCPDFEQGVLLRRLSRAAARKNILSGQPLSSEEQKLCGEDPHIFKILFLAHCTRSKGLFDTLDGVARANATLASSQSPIRIQISVAGAFVSNEDQKAFSDRIRQTDLELSVRHENFVSGPEKTRLFVESDCFCFPTYHYAESFGLVLVEAMAFGLPIITSRWRSIPEVMPKGYGSLVEPRDVDRIADELLAKINSGYEPELRRHFLANFTIDKHLENLSAAFHTVA